MEGFVRGWAIDTVLVLCLATLIPLLLGFGIVSGSEGWGEITILDNVIASVPPASQQKEERGESSGFESRQPIPHRYFSIGTGFVVDGFEVNLNVEAVEAYGRDFIIYLMTSDEYGLWTGQKSAKILLEKSCPWQCKFSFNMLEMQKIVVVAFLPDKKEIPAVVIKYTLSYLVPIRGSKLSYRADIPIDDRDKIIIEGGFRSDAPVNIWLASASDLESPKTIVYHKAENMESGRFQFDLPPVEDRWELPHFYVILSSKSRTWVNVTLWASAKYRGGQLITGKESWEKEIRLSLAPPTNLTELQSFQILKLSGSPISFWQAEGFYIRPYWFIPASETEKVSLSRISIHAEEPDGLRFKLILVDYFNYLIFREQAKDIFKEPYDVLRFLTKIYESEYGSTVTADIKSFPYPVEERFVLIVIRHPEEKGNLAVKLQIKYYVNIPQRGSSINELVFHPLVFLRGPYNFVGRFISDGPVTIAVGTRHFTPMGRTWVYHYRTQNSASGEFSFYTSWAGTDTEIHASNNGDKRVSLVVWLKATPAQVSRTVQESATFGTTVKPPESSQIHTDTRTASSVTSTGTVARDGDVRQELLVPVLIAIIAALSIALVLTMLRGRTRREKASFQRE